MADSHQRLRLRLKPQAPTTGYVDGGWWPRSRDLATELPALLAVLAIRLGPIERVGYNLTAWGPTVRKIYVGGSVVRLAGYHSQHPDTVDVLGARRGLTLLVVPPDASAQAAHRVLMTAGHRGNTDQINELLRPAKPAPQPVRTISDEIATAVQAWELDGGRVYSGV